MAKFALSSRGKATVAIAIAIGLGVTYLSVLWIDAAPLSFLITVAIVTLLFLTLRAIYGERLFLYTWRWDLWASKFKAIDINEFADEIANGVASIGNLRVIVDVVAISDGVIIRNNFPPNKSGALIPWSTVTRISRYTATYQNSKECEPFELAQIYLSEPSSTILILPWRESYDRRVPDNIGFENLGRCDVAL